MELSVLQSAGLITGSVAAPVALFILLWRTRRNGYQAVQKQLNNLAGIPNMLEAIKTILADRLVVCHRRMELQEKRTELVEKVMATIEKRVLKRDKITAAIEKRVVRLEKANSN